MGMAGGNCNTCNQDDQQPEKSLFAGMNACKLLKLNKREVYVSSISRAERFKTKLKSRVGRFIISKLVK